MVHNFLHIGALRSNQMQVASMSKIMVKDCVLAQAAFGFCILLLYTCAHAIALIMILCNLHWCWFSAIN